MQYIVKRFEELSRWELYEIFKLRVDVFVAEQASPYNEIDAREPISLHTWLRDETGGIAAYSRVYEEEGAAHIGRLIVAPAHRGQGLGREIMARSLELARRESPGRRIAIGAQSHLREFYKSFGFVPVSEEYLDAGVPHIDMVLEAE